MEQNKKNPSRKTCEDTIKRILMTEVLENGRNIHFKNSTDFMKFFESLYPASDALTKQVQRAIKALDIPKDEDGFYIINKTSKQLDQDKELSRMLHKTSAEISSISECETLFLKLEPEFKSYLLQLICQSDAFQDKYETIVDSSNGLIFYTNNKAQLSVLITSLME